MEKKFTGYYDSNNEKIFEGDTIEFNRKYAVPGSICPYRLKVTFENGKVNFATFDLGRDAWTIIK